MTRTDRPTADDLILDLLVEGVAPTHDNLVAAIVAYPQHRDALIEFFATLGVQSQLGPETVSDGCATERFTNMGVSRVLELRYRRAQQHKERQASQPAPARLSRLARQRGLDEASLAARVGLDEGLVMKLDLHRIRSPRPMKLFERLGAELEVPPAHVIAAATGPPLASSRGNFRKARREIRVDTESFEEAIRASSLSEDDKANWLSLLADEGEPKA